MFEGIFQPTHLVLILIVVLIVFGPGKLPEVGKALGKTVHEFRRATSAAHEESEDEKKALPAAREKVEVLDPSRREAGRAAGA
ncbi:MAG: twin-arginine translocase TatA/TatE family subunit [Firmicutes bacterium]|nr:twin-arginine translocase TatA/TatE family subunit [Bacillota bacterium]